MGRRLPARSALLDRHCPSEGSNIISDSDRVPVVWLWFLIKHRSQVSPSQGQDIVAKAQSISDIARVESHPQTNITPFSLNSMEQLLPVVEQTIL